MNRRRLLAILLVLAVVVIGGVLYFSNSNKSAAIIQDPQVASNVQFPWYDGAGKLYFYTGTSFASYDTSTAQTTQLGGPLYITSQLSNFNWTSSSVIFYANQYSSTDQLGEAVSRAGLSLTTGHWWRYSFKDQALQLVAFSNADNCESLVEADGSLLCVLPHLGSQISNDIYRYDVGSHQLSTIANAINDVSQPLPSSSGIYFVSTTISGTQQLKKLDVATSSISTVFSSPETISAYGVDGSGDILLAQAPLPKTPTQGGDVDTVVSFKQNLVLLDPAGKTLSKNTLSDGAGKVINLGSQLLYYSPAGPERLAGAGAISKLPYEVDKAISYHFQVNGSRFEVDGSNYLSSNAKLPTPYKDPASFTESLNPSEGSFFVSAQHANQNTVYAYDFSKDFNATATEVDQFLSSHGFDPNQFNLAWSLQGNEGTVVAADNAAILN